MCGDVDKERCYHCLLLSAQWQQRNWFSPAAGVVSLAAVVSPPVPRPGAGHDAAGAAAVRPRHR